MAMSTDDKLKQFVKRFVNECKKKGIANPADLSEATIKAGYPISYTSAYKNWIGQNYPGLPSLIAYAETLGINIHYLVTGEQPPMTDPKKLFKEFFEEHFQSTPSDQQLRRLSNAWDKMTPKQREALLVVVDAFVKIAE